MGRKKLEKISVGWWKIGDSNEEEKANELKKRRQSMEQRQQDSYEKRLGCGKLRVEQK